MLTLSAFADEVIPAFCEQIAFLVNENVKFIEIRFVNGKNILDCSNSELHDIIAILEDNGIKVSALGSPIGKIRIDEPFAPHLDRFKRAVEIAQALKTKMIRIFSYYGSQQTPIAQSRDAVLDRMRQKLELIKNTDTILCHENEADIYGQSAQACLDIVQSINSPKLKLVYDPANFVTAQGISDNMQKCWPLLKPYVIHVHIKDWKIGSDIGSLPGTGDAQIQLLLKELLNCNYKGFITLEPHLQKGGQFGGTTGNALFSDALMAIREMIIYTESHKNV